jgi:hypothetical protein
LSANAYWTALEALIKLYPIAIHGSRCEKCGQTKGRTQDAIIDLLKLSLGCDQETLEQANVLLSKARKIFRISWVHSGILPAADFDALPEFWLVADIKDRPTWNQVGEVVWQLQDFVEQIIFAAIRKSAYEIDAEGAVA